MATFLLTLKQNFFFYPELYKGGGLVSKKTFSPKFEKKEIKFQKIELLKKTLRWIFPVFVSQAFKKTFPVVANKSGTQLLSGATSRTRQSTTSYHVS